MNAERTESVAQAFEALQPAADQIATSASTVAEILRSERRPAKKELAWRLVKALLIYGGVVCGAVFTLEQYLASEYHENAARMEGMLSGASQALGSNDHIAQANALRILSRIGGHSTYKVEAGVASVGRHLRATVFGYEPEYPYFDQAWLLLRDFATSRTDLTSALVSSELLRQGSLWEQRTRQREGTPLNNSHGSLLFRARLPGAIGNDLNLRGIQFGGAQLQRAVLLGSHCQGCGFLKADLTDAKLQSVVLDSAYLAEAILTRADLSFASLRSAVLTKARLGNVTFLQADLAGADLRATLLDGSVFSQTNLTGTNFAGASLRGVRFVQSDVGSASFANADIRGADFTRAYGFNPDLLRSAINVAEARVPSATGGHE